jgi:origin recognition complex subunit 2
MAKRPAPLVSADPEFYAIGRDFFVKKSVKETKKNAEAPPLRHVTFAAEKLEKGDAHKETGRGLSNQKHKDIKELIKDGWPVMLHGHGSKIDVLDTFTQDFLSEYTVVMIEGFDARLAFNRCLAAAVAVTTKRKLKDIQHLSVDALLSQILLNNKTKNIAFVVKSLDGVALRSHQTAVMKLADNFAFIASVDHVRAPLLWDQSTVEKFVWREISTFVPYHREVLGSCGMLLPAWSGLGTTEAGVKRQSLQVVMVSLTPNHRQLVELLAKLQSAEDKGAIKKTVLLEKSRKAMIASDQNKLNSLLIELIDHGIVKIRKDNENGLERLFIPGTRAEVLRYSKGDFSVDDDVIFDDTDVATARGG